VNIGSVFVLPQSEEDGVAELAVGGHFGETELGDGAGFEPGDVALARRVGERRRGTRQR